jgi:hypothetical protein
MNIQLRSAPRLAVLALAFAVAAGCASMKQEATGQQVRLEGGKEVPPVTTTAYGDATVNVTPDRFVTVTLSVMNMTPTAAHIHSGAAGANGPVIVPLNKISENSFVAADGARMTEEQYAAYKAGNTYLNAHSAKNPGGEIRGQLVGR